MNNCPYTPGYFSQLLSLLLTCGWESMDVEGWLYTLDTFHWGLAILRFWYLQGVPKTYAPEYPGTT